MLNSNIEAAMTGQLLLCVLGGYILISFEKIVEASRKQRRKNQYENKEEKKSVEFKS